MARIRVDDSGFTADAFLALAERVWPRDDDASRTAAALERSSNIGAWDGDRLVGAVRVLSDGYFFACVSEILVDPEYQRQGIGGQLMDAALAIAPGSGSLPPCRRGARACGGRRQSPGFRGNLGSKREPLMNWRDHITSSPEVLGGKPVVRGTRLAVEFLLGLSAAGWSEAQILANYPSVSADALRAVYGYAAEAISEDTLYPVHRLAG